MKIAISLKPVHIEKTVVTAIKGGNMSFKELLKNDFIFLDGAMGTMLQAKGLQLGGIPELININNPEWIMDIHQSYIKSGANIIYTNTFGANRYKLVGSGYSVEEIISKAVEIARASSKGTDTLVALDLGPIGQLLEPTGSLKFEEAYEIFKEQIIAGKGADIIVLETMTDLYEVKAAVLAAKENSSLPIICTMTFEENGRTFTGCSVSAMALTLGGLGVDAIGVNCSLGPKELFPIVKELSEWTNLPIVIKPNAGLPDPITNAYNVSPDEFADYMAEFAELGVKILGGCCGTTADYIKALTKKLSMIEQKLSVKKIPTAVCSSSKTIIIDRPRVIGERINPTGKKIFQQALINHDINYILNQAVEQVSAGADILDVNVGLPEIDEKSIMIEVVKALQSILDTPLQIDSSDIHALEAGLRVYNGKAIVNSVNAEDESLDSVLPLVKKYGACVVGLTLDKNGIPKTAEGRFKLAEKIMNRAIEYGIPKEDVFIDCLTLTASAEQKGVMETLKAVKLVKKRLGLKTVLGVSNISFGLPNREIINYNFLTMALSYGLDLPIINPNISSMMGAVRSYNLLTNIDKNAIEFIDAYGTEKNPTSTIKSDKEIDIFYAMEHGLKAEGAKITAKLLETKEPMSIVNEILIPALDKVGEDFEKGIIFLPQLILSAGVAQSAFEVIKENLFKNNITSESKGTIVLATVKGDIHDIGKNIVKVLLENYGYTVVDLGKDVDYQAVVDATIKHNSKLVGLSALMTTTLKSMEETIKLLRDNNLDCKVMVGGAVLTPDYAIKIGADYYSKDAKESVDIARKVLG